MITAISLIGAVVGFLVAIKNAYPLERNAFGSFNRKLVGPFSGRSASGQRRVGSTHSQHKHDIVDPPQFRELVGQRVESGANPLVYDAEVLGPQQQAAYPWITTKTLNGTISDRQRKQLRSWRIWACTLFLWIRSTVS